MSKEDDEIIEERKKQIEAAQEQLRQQADNATVDELRESDPDK